jgi:chromosome segregation ATPase
VSETKQQANGKVEGRIKELEGELESTRANLSRHVQQVQALQVRLEEERRSRIHLDELVDLYRGAIQQNAPR